MTKKKTYISANARSRSNEQQLVGSATL